MRIRGATVLLRLMREECGQAMAVLGLGIFLLVGLAGVSIEVGHGYYALELLQASTNAATLAAAAGLPDGTAATTYANDYSSKANQENRIGLLQNVALTVTPYCSSSVATTFTVPCQAASSGAAAYNAVSVVQTAVTPLWFGPFGHVPLFNLSATGTAAMAGGNFTPYNIAIVLDTTGSMNQPDTSGDCGTGSVTAEQCALQGVQTLLSIAYPCAAGQTCTSSGATADDAVSLFVFPMITGATASKDSDCSSSSPTTAPYTLPTQPAETFTSGAPTGGQGYQVLTFANGVTYRSSDTSTGLRSGDLLAQAAGANGCSGLAAPGGRGTYLAQVIYEAGQALQLEQAARPGSNNIMILLSDGNMTATMQYTKSGSTITGLAGPTAGTPSELQPTNGVLSGGSSSQINGTKVPAWSAQQNTYTFPSAVGQCGQAVQAAYDVANHQTVTYSAGGLSTTFTLNNSNPTAYTKVYTVAYQSPNSSTGSGNSSSNPDSSSSSEACYTDISYNANNNYWTACTAATCTPTIVTSGGSWPAGEAGYNTTGGSATVAPSSPCATLAAMATSPEFFYSDQGGGCPVTFSGNAVNKQGNSINPNVNGLTTMQQIFSKIITSLSSPKLIPNGTS